MHVDYVSIRTESHINICMTPSIDDANSNFRYDRCVRVKVTFNFKSVLRFLPNLVVITGMVLKRKLLEAFSVIIVQVRIFTGLDTNNLK